LHGLLKKLDSKVPELGPESNFFKSPCSTLNAAGASGQKGIAAKAQKRKAKILNLFHSAYLRNAFADRC
jgi:hypothetical protein